ncbi:type II secretion system minor pseudopilin GspK [Thermodesulfobacteriota bacterium]
MDGAMQREGLKKDQGASKGENGAALITVLLIAALVTVIAVSMTSRQQIDIRRTANVIGGDQAQLLARGVVSWGIRVLKRDDAARDHLGEDWAIGLIPTEIEGGGQISGFFEDMQGRFNVNTLISKDQKRRTFSQEHFTRLLEQCELDGDLVYAVIDWIDPDSNVTAFGGGEDESYMNHDPPYKTANQPMKSPSELLLVNGFTAEAYNCLAPHIAVLPDTETDLNVNTVSAFVLDALSDTLTFVDAEEIVENRPANGYDDVAEFLQLPQLIGHYVAGPTNTEYQGYFSVKSSYFLAQSYATAGEGKTSLFSLLFRDGKKVTRESISIGVY